MLRDVFKSIGGIENYGLISMIIFVFFFALLILHTFSLKRKDVDDFSRMPLDDVSKESDDIQDI
ncbi:MAG: CcoQ/FixQ family Cbb3-type cytochrome c oxidase assembly chaperone [Bacteroidetes bacterium]|nr:CcoQ/FixQ family Cbb3-type cytochrome c oxidase assembly chaperone [Bacteroidota bacterium]